MIKTINLSNGVEMPSIIMVTNWMDYPQLKEVVKAGMKIGYRAFDTARDYGNEPIVGRVIKECLEVLGIKREEIFITTKIGNGQQKMGNIEDQMDAISSMDEAYKYHLESASCPGF